MTFQVGSNQVRCNTWKVALLLAISYAFALCQAKEYEINERAVGDWSKWSPWGKYGVCSSKCGVGYTYKTRSRKCMVPPCKGSDLDIVLNTCYSDECPGNNQHSSLAQWSPCLPECGDGVKVRAQSTPERELIWEAIQCKANCPEKMRRKRWFGSGFGGSTSVSSSGSKTHTVTISTPIGTFKGSITTSSKGKLTGGSVGYSKNFGIGNVDATLGYNKDKGLSAGVKGDINLPGGKISGEANYDFKDKSGSWKTSASAGPMEISHSSDSGTSVKVNTPGKRLVNIPSEVDKLCKKIGDGLFKYPGDCQRYVDCEKGVAYIARCLDGEAWDNEVKRCEPADDIGCDN